MKNKLIRVSTVPVSLNILLKNQFIFLSRYFDLVAVSSRGSDLEELEIRERVRIVPVEMKRNISVFKDMLSLWRLYQVFRKEKPAIVHSITPKAGLLSMIAAKMAGVPVRMHTFTGLIFPSQKGMMKQLLIMMDRLLCLCATNIYPEGNGVRRDLINYRITSKPLKVLANGNVNGIDLEYFKRSEVSESDCLDLRSSLDFGPDDFVFIFIGRLVGDKGINELVAAFKNLNISSAKLLLVGPLEIEIDPLLPETLDEIRDNKNIVSVGFQKDVRKYLAISDVLTFPSYREGFPNVVMQAGAMELPSIVTDINGCNEIIVNGENGIIIPPKNVLELQKVMLKFATDPLLCSQLKSKARSMVANRFDQREVWEALLAEYQNLIKEHVK